MIAALKFDPRQPRSISFEIPCVASFLSTRRRSFCCCMRWLFRSELRFWSASAKLHNRERKTESPRTRPSGPRYSFIHIWRYSGALDKSHCSGLEYPSTQHFLPLDLMSNGFEPRSKSTTVCWCLDDLTAPVGDFCASVSYRKRSERVSEMRWVQWWSTAMDERTHKESHFGSLDT